MGAVVGSGGLLSGCGGEDVQRNRYASREACLADYSEELCRPDFPISGYVAGAATYYYGPWYHSDFRARENDQRDPGAGRFFHGGGAGVVASSGSGVAPLSVETGTRGGFGSTGRISARGT
jgi:hypothetical protein